MNYIKTKIVIEKSSLNPLEVTRLKQLCSGANPAYQLYKRMLQSKPWIARSSKYPKPPETIELYEETDTHLTIPKGLLEEVSIPLEDHTTINPVTFNFKGELREYQVTAIKKLIKSRYGVLESTTGSGKTVMAMALAEALGQQTLFIVHTKALLNQTVEAVDKFLGIKAGIIGSGKRDIQNFTVATIQTLQRGEIPLNTFGLVLIDECHHIPSTTFSKVIMKLDSHYMYGLSATPKRPDGLTWALTATVGPFLHTVPKAELVKNKSVIKPCIIRVDTPYVPSKNYDAFDLTQHLEDIANSNIRNTFICNHFDSIYRSNPEMSAIILTDRTAHAENLSKNLKQYNPVLLHGKLPEKTKLENLKLVKLGNTKVTIATYAFVGEGFDVPAWDTLFLASPFSSIIRLTQVVGRICRPAKNKNEAYVYDYADVNDPVLMSRYYKREVEYKNE